MSLRVTMVFVWVLCMSAVVYGAGPVSNFIQSDKLNSWQKQIVNMPTERGYPFSFVYDGQLCNFFLGNWTRTESVEQLDDNRTRLTISWVDPATKLKVTWEAICFSDFPAVEWLIYFENTGSADTRIIKDIQALEMVLKHQISRQVPYRLYTTKGGTPTPDHFMASVVEFGRQKRFVVLGSGNGRSSTKNFPFFKIDSGDGSTIVAVGWSGHWTSKLKVLSDRQLHVNAGMGYANFRLHPGEKVRMPRILLLHWKGDTWESNAQFRQLIYKHYAAKRSGKRLLPTPYSNTCFTRGGTWLNETTADNQISLINAYAPMGAEAVLTDAGWFEGGWPAGAGNWDPRKDHYPDGMGPVAAAAKDQGIIYGLWFEPERVMKGTWLQKNHPEWLLHSTDGQESRYLLNFGLPEVQDYFFNIVKGFMELPGFSVYRQDFNMDPLPYWRHSDKPDRQGITEIKYIQGLYAYWERIAKTWPDSLRIECASGGHRIDIETVMRMHIHQKTDYWFRNETNQGSIWGLSQYLPNNVFMTAIDRLDDYSFHSAMQSSFCMGWIADAPDFDKARGKKLLDRYRQVRHLMIGAWYPLTFWSIAPDNWIGSQYHRPDLDEGIILVFRRPQSPYPLAELSLHALTPDAVYKVSSDRTGKALRLKGSELMRKFVVELPEKHSSDLIHYQKEKD